MKILPKETLQVVFVGDDIPGWAYELMLSVPDDTPDGEVITALRMGVDMRQDKRIGVGLEVVQRIYSLPGKTFEESQPADKRAMILASFATVFTELFKTLDKMEKEKGPQPSLATLLQNTVK